MEMLVGIVTATPELLLNCVAIAAKGCSRPMNLAVHGNGFVPDEAALRAVATLGDVILSSTEDNIGVTRGLHVIWEKAREAGGYDLIAYQHDDLDVYEENWDLRVIDCFERNPDCVLASFSGAESLGTHELYVEPYQLEQLARHGFMSNQRSAERHGERVTYDMPSATFDSFSMICRMSFLDTVGGWNWYPYPCHNIDNSMACMAKRHGKETWYIGVDCEHHGGSTSTKPVYHDYAQAQFGGDVKIHADSHQWMYDEFRDVLPL